MGKQEEEAIGAGGDQLPADTCSCCNKSTCRWIVSVVVSVQLLVFAVLSIHFHGRSDKPSWPTSSVPWKAQIEASFRLRRPVSVVNASLYQLQSDLQDEVGLPNTQVDVISVQPLSSPNWTEVRFGVSPEPVNESIVPADLSLLKETFVELFMEQSVNLSLTRDLFGKVLHFEVVEFPGGITIVPEQPGFPLVKLLVLFNFTLHNSLSHLDCNFAEFRQQLADGISLKADESLFVQLTNLEGSTLKSPVIVQTSILPLVGALPSPPRLKQLAQEIVASPRRNLGLNHTLFGRVKGIELSSYLRHSLKPAHAPSPGPSPSAPPAHPPRSHEASRPRGSRGQRAHSPAAAPLHSPAAAPLHPYHRARAPASHGISAAHHHHHHHHGTGQALAPRLSPTPQPSPFISGSYPPAPTSNPALPGHSSTHSQPSRPPSPSFAPVVSPYPGKFPVSQSRFPPHPAPLVNPPHMSPALLKGPSVAPSQASFAPGSGSASGSSPSQIPERIASAPAVSPVSSAPVLGFPFYAMVTSLVLVIMIW